MRSLRILVRVAGWAAVVLLFIAICLVAIGLPGSLAERWIGKWLGDDAVVQCGRLRLAPLRGIVAQNLSVALHGDIDALTLEAERLAISLSTRRSTSGRAGLFTLDLDNGLLRKGAATSVAIPRGSAYLEREGEMLTIRRFEGLFGIGDEQGPIRGNFTYDLDEDRYAGAFDSVCQPTLFVPVLPTHFAEVVNSIHFEQPPLLSFEFSGEAGQPQSLVVHGRAFAGRNERHGVEVDLMHANVHFENGVLRFDNIVVIPPEGSLRGTIRQDFQNADFLFEGQCDANPLATARIILPKFEAWMEPYLPPAPTDLTGSIGLRYGTNTHVEIHANVEGDGLGYGPVVTDRGSARVDVSGRSIAVTNMDGTWCGGRLTGSVLSDVEDGTTNRFVKLDLVLEGAEMGALVSQFSDAMEPSEHVGRVGAKVAVSGVTPAFLDSLSGEGTIQVRNGLLFSTRVGRGLSGYLSKLHLPLEPKSTQECDVSFHIEDRTIHIDEFSLRSQFNTITGRGTCSMDGALKLRVSVKFLHKGLTARAVQILTLPATELLDFECTGTLTEPEWHAVNAPRNLLKLFRGDDTPEQPAP